MIALPAALCLLMAGCVNSLPTPPDPLHAVFSTRPRTSLGINETYDTIVMVEVETREEYATRKHGDWITEWSLCKSQVLQVLYGKLSDQRLNIRCASSYPTPESGILLEIALGPMQTGNLVVLFLDTTTKPYRIVFCQTRIPKNEWNQLTPNDNFNIMRAVETYLDFCPSHLGYLGKTDASYVVSDGARTISVDRTTWTAKQYTGDEFKKRQNR